MDIQLLNWTMNIVWKLEWAEYKRNSIHFHADDGHFHTIVLYSVYIFFSSYSENWKSADKVSVVRLKYIKKLVTRRLSFKVMTWVQHMCKKTITMLMRSALLWIYYIQFMFSSEESMNTQLTKKLQNTIFWKYSKVREVLQI